MPSSSKKLVDLCAPVFILAIQLQSHNDYGEPEILRRRVKDMLERLDRQARNAQIEVAAMQQARFALVAFIDESILSSAWNQKALWMGRSLNSEFYGKSDAGDEFFTRLNELCQRVPANAEVIQVYYQCLVLGFKGRYFSKPDQLRILMEDIYNSLRNLNDKHTSPDQIAPHAMPEEMQLERAKSGLSWIWAIMGSAVVLLIFFIVLKLMISSRANELI